MHIWGLMTRLKVNTPVLIKILVKGIDFNSMSTSNYLQKFTL